MKKKQLHEALAVLLTKLSYARDNPLLIDNYVVKALRTTLVTFKESGELHKALKEQIQTAMKSNNPWINILMKSMNIDSSIDALLNAGTQNTMTLANQLATCCCNLKSAITEGNYQNQIATIQQTDAIKQSVGDVGNAVTRGFSDMGYALRDQTCNIDKSIDVVGDRIIAKLDASEKSSMQDKIIAGIENEVAGMKGDIAKILAAVTKQ